ncbi:MAG: glutamate racemase [Bacteroidetes bacterium]|nr:glutamate racemase [Bacteroidota bacterium]
MTGDTRPIGVFDSGIGGLTVASAIRKRLPGQPIIYFGDTVHLPYGDKSVHSIRGYIKEISSFLLGQNCSRLVVACNSASSVLQKDTVVPGFTEVLNVIDPVAACVASDLHIKKVGVIGTRRTIQSHIYKKRLLKLREDLEVVELATPLLAPMIEEGFIKNSIAETVIHTYLDQLGKIDALILGCTHYPLIKPQIESYYQGSVLLFDAPELIAENLAGVSELSHQTVSIGTNHFYVSDYTQSFEETAKLFFGEIIHLEEKLLF